MTRREERQEASRKRAEEHQRRIRTRRTLFWVGVFMYVVVPLLWNGAIEFGLIHPIRNPEFKNSINTGALVALFLILFNVDWALGRKNKSHEEASTTSTTGTN